MPPKLPINLPKQDSAKGKGKSKPKAKAAPEKETAQTPKGKPAPKSKNPSTGKKHPAPAPAANLPPLFNLSTDRKMDLVGIAMMMAGLVMFLSRVSPNNGGVTGPAIGAMAFLFGLGGYILPIIFILYGGWLVFRKIEYVPAPSLERTTGVILMTLFLHAALQGITGNPAEFINGGGWIGSIFYRMLDESLGVVGAWIALMAWFLIATSLTLDLSIPEIFAYFKPLWDRLLQLWKGLLVRWRGHQPAPIDPMPVSPNDGFTPLNTTQPAAPTQSAQPGQVGIPVTTSSAQVNWVLPSAKEMLNLGSASEENQEYIEQRARLIEETLASFGAPAQVVEINSGPTVTQFGVEPLFIESRSGRTRVRVSKIVSLADDLALALAAPRIRIQAPVPGRSYLGIEVPNEEMTLVSLREIVEGDVFQRGKKPLSFALGRDVSGHPISADLASMPHLLIAGTTGSGKSVCVNTILTCLLLNNTPDDLRLVLVDPKRVELTGYNGIPHLLSPVVVEMERVIGALQWMTREMDRRYHMFAQVGARNITDFNARQKTQGQKKLPFLVVIIDELADLMMLAPDETERTITRLAQLARATGIHLILATQRPSVDVVTGLIKANFPARVAFAVASNTDSRVILDQPGAERLLGRGDMLYQSPEAPAPVRLQGVFVADTEIHRIVEFWQAQNAQAAPIPTGGAVDGIPNNLPLKQTALFEDMSPVEQGDVLFDEAVDLIRREGRASVSMLQRRLRIGYTRAARLIDNIEDKGIIGPPEDNTGVRKVLDYGPTAPPKET